MRVIIMSRIFEIFKKSRIYIFLLSLLDLLSLSLAYQLSYVLVENGSYLKYFWEDHLFLKYFLIMVPLWILLIMLTGNAQIPRTRRYTRLLIEFLQFTFFNFVTLGIVALNFWGSISFLFVIATAGFSLFSLFGFRMIEYKFFKFFRSKGHNFINAVLIGDGQSELFIQNMLDKREWGYKILFIVSDSKLLKAKFGSTIKIIPEKSFATLRTLLQIDIIDEVIFCKGKHEQEKITKLIRWCEELGIIFKFPARLSPLLLTNGYSTFLDNQRFVTFSNIPVNSIGITWKNFFDFYISLIILTMISPILLLIAILVKYDSNGPVFFKQARVGLRGRQFYLYKFRTMVVNAEELRKKMEEMNEMDGPVFKVKDDPRITKIGKVLRKTGLDELPQIINVLKGEMSLIGPRPPLMSEVVKYQRWQLRRLSVRPGITGLWQVQPDRNNIKFESWMKMDLEYIDGWSPKLDTLLLFKTLKTVIFRTGS
jgi:exopolysaccharide biosynthesis polyprenyl glycosylphosphotransferase